MSQSHDAGVKMSWRKVRSCGPSDWPPCLPLPPSRRQVTKAEGAALAGRFGCLFFEVSACLDFEHVQHVFHEAVREARRELERSPPPRPLFIAEDRAPVHQVPLTASGCTFNTLSTFSLKEMPAVAQAKLVTVKSSRAQSKRKVPTLTLLKGFKIF